MQTLGERIASYRRAANMTQAELAEACSVTAQAVSKWENDLTAPDISLLPKLAELFHITTDELLGVQRQTVTAVDPAKVDMSKMLFRVRVLSKEGDEVSLNLPLALAELFLSNEAMASKLFGGAGAAEKVFGGGGDVLSIDLKQLVTLVKLGVTGKLVEVETADGDKVEVWVE